MWSRRAKSIVGMLAVTTLAIPALAGCGESSSADPDAGKVYFINFKPEVADEWTEIAKAYTEETGVQVDVQTAASGTYEQTLKSEIAKSDPPTIFQVNGPVGLTGWTDYTDDLSDTEIYKQLTDQNLALKIGDKVVGVPYAVESYGLIYNKDLLADYFELPDAAVSSVDDINSFKTLKEVADGIQENAEELGVKGAFTSAGFDSSSDWRFKTHLANIPLAFELEGVEMTPRPVTIEGKYLSQYKDIFDLYLDDSTTDRKQISSKNADDSISEFALGEAVFYQNGTWAWTDLQKAGVDPDQVGMIPIYIGAPNEEEYGLATGSNNFWCINEKASEADKKASAEFLEWMITSDKGKEAINTAMGFATPFKSFADEKSDNPLVQIGLDDLNSGKKPVDWKFTSASDTWKNNVGFALLEYIQGTGDWSGVETAFVDGWAEDVAAIEGQD